ncbi:hypothetical protein ZIOFF_001268 [Zingiber officinale]|uniref:Uncharacterized protein n=1 Tax=Zingiber officinale TaxID=94328 RepID=A0A8J5I5P1_ZINOF|nr:hypothetical protein ZIOFF_001268 [Zingiber officinale]
MEQATPSSSSGCRRCGSAAVLATAPSVVQKLMRKLTRTLTRKVRRKSNILCMTTATKPAAFHCQYDLLSCSMNFKPIFGELDGGAEDVKCTFTSRFASAAASGRWHFNFY